MPPRLNLSQFKGDSDSEGDDLPAAPKKQPVLSTLKQHTFSHGTYKKSRLDIEKETAERKRVEEEQAAARVFKEFSEAFEGDGAETAPRGGTTGDRSGYGGRGGRGGGSMRGGFVKASGDSSTPAQAYQPPPRQPPSGTASSSAFPSYPPGPPGPPSGPGFNAFAPPTGPRQLPTGPSASRLPALNAYGSGSNHPSSSRPPPGPSAYGAGPTLSERADESNAAKPKAKGKRAMDSFLEEIKREQEVREKKFGDAARQDGTSVSALAAWERNRGSHDLGDKETTNIYISNLPSGINEESLGLFFAKYGPIGAVKIMWPRGDEDTSVGASITSSRRSKAGLSGFVAYMRRKDAEMAVKELDGLDWGGTIIRVGWSKMVKIPLRALYDLSGSQSRDKSRSRSPAKRHRREAPTSRSQSPVRESRRRSRSRSRSPPPSRGGMRNEGRSRSRSPIYADRRDDRGPGRSRSRGSVNSYSSRSSRSPSPLPDVVKKPAKKGKQEIYLEKLLVRLGPEKEKFVTAVANKVKQHGVKFEEVLREREERNEKFAFLRDVDLPEYHLYRQITDSRYRLPSPPADGFGDDGKADLYSSDSAEDSEKERTRKGTLGKMARKRFECGLRAVTGERGEIARLMQFSMTHADAADEICDLICESLMVETTPVPRKMARFHLISDILHNAASPLPNVWRYRQAFENRLPAVFEHLADVHRSLVAYAGRLSAETFKQQVSFVVDIWDNWIVFTPAVTEKMRGLLDGAKADGDEEVKVETSRPADNASLVKALPSKFKKTTTTSNFKTVAPGPNAFVHDLDGEAMDLDGAPMEDLDGEDLDGEDMLPAEATTPFDDDLDGEMMDV